MSNPVILFEVVGRDVAALQRFYREAFRWQLTPVVPGYAVALPGDDRGTNGGIGSPAASGEPRVPFYIEVADPEATLQDVERLGGRRIIDPVDVPGGPSFALFADPEGHVVGITRTPLRLGHDTQRRPQAPGYGTPEAIASGEFRPYWLPLERRQGD